MKGRLLQVCIVVGGLGLASCAAPGATRASDVPQTLPEEPHDKPEAEGKAESAASSTQEGIRPARADSDSAHDIHAGGLHSHNRADEPPSTSQASSAPGSSQGTSQEEDEEARDELAAYEKAKPTFETHCARCHTSQGAKSSKNALRHFNMDDYPFGGHHAHDLTATLRKVLGMSGSKPTMPRDKPGAVHGQELDLVAAWATAYDRARAPGDPRSEHKH